MKRNLMKALLLQKINSVNIKAFLQIGMEFFFWQNKHSFDIVLPYIPYIGRGQGGSDLVVCEFHFILGLPC